MQSGAGRLLGKGVVRRPTCVRGGGNRECDRNADVREVGSGGEWANGAYGDGEDVDDGDDRLTQ